MIRKSIYMFLFISFLPAHVAFAKEGIADNAKGLDIKQSEAVRELVKDETLRRMVKENAVARRKKRQQVALERLEKEEALRRRSVQTEKQRFFFTLQRLTAAVV